MQAPRLARLQVVGNAGMLPLDFVLIHAWVQEEEPADISREPIRVGHDLIAIDIPGAWQDGAKKFGGNVVLIPRRLGEHKEPVVTGRQASLYLEQVPHRGAV